MRLVRCSSRCGQRWRPGRTVDAPFPANNLPVSAALAATALATSANMSATWPCGTGGEGGKGAQSRRGGRRPRAMSDAQMLLYGCCCPSARGAAPPP